MEKKIPYITIVFKNIFITIAYRDVLNLKGNTNASIFGFMA